MKHKEIIEQFEERIEELDHKIYRSEAIMAKRLYEQGVFRSENTYWLDTLLELNKTILEGIK